MIKIAKYIYQKAVVASRVKQLAIKESGRDNEGYSFITLKNNLTFFGPDPAQKERKFYSFLLPKSIKKQLPFHCFQIAIDIVIRYQEGNLKWGGPAKEAFYQVKEGDKIAEMGAFRGYYTIYLSKKIGAKGRVIAIEPIPENVKYLEKNVASNQLDNVTIVPKGVWNENDQKIFQRKTTDYQSGSIDITYSDSDSKSIEVNTLDKILTDSNVESIDFMLIQLNGAEYEALENLTKFSPNHFSIAARYDKNGRDIAREIQNLLKERGYETSTLQKKFIYAHLN